MLIFDSNNTHSLVFNMYIILKSRHTQRCTQSCTFLSITLCRRSRSSTHMSPSSVREVTDQQAPVLSEKLR